jgi:GT2 family glycosyltransferase
MLYVYTLNWNGLDKLQRLSPTLSKNLEGLDYQWWVRDNGSTDGSKDYIKSNIKHYLDVNHNRDNFSVGMNSLFESSKPDDEDFILLLNNDLWFGDNLSVKKMIDCFSDDVGVVGARILYPNTDLLQHGGVYFSRKYNCLPYHFRHKQKSSKDDEKTKEFQAVTAACMLTKAKYYKNIAKNGFDENYHWSFEDIDACLSIKYNMGKKIIYCGKTKIYHEESASLKKNPVNKLMLNHNVAYFRSKWSGKYEIEE